ncbi:MAG TPA: hypothetical protein VKN14_11450 [Flavobacteriaceae bacterium]|nr:hypothetical protein [Flavobacteriaceae bacterium]
MRLLKQGLDFYLNSSIHVAFSVVALSCITFFEFDLLFNKNLLFFIFFASITGYNFVKYYGIAKWHHRHLTRWLKVIQVFSLLCFLAMCYFAFRLPLKTLAIILAFGVLTFFYAIPFLPKKMYLDEHKNLRNISGLKVYVIALVWAGVTVFLPVVNENYILSTDVWITFFQRFLFVIVLTLPFEIRDLQYDDLKLSTIPQKTGVKQAKIIGVILLMAFFFLEFFKDQLKITQIMALLIISFFAMLFLVFTKKNQGKYYSAFWVEGLPMAWLVIILLFD